MVMSVPSPSTVKAPPSRIIGAAYRSQPKCSQRSRVTSASLSYGRYFSPHELKGKSATARRPSGPSRKYGPLSRIHESSIGSSTTSMLSLPQ